MRVTTKCSTCDKKRAYMFVIGHEEFAMLACLYCVKAADCLLECDLCGTYMGNTDGLDTDDLDVFCPGCFPHGNALNVECHKCGAVVGHVEDKEQAAPWKAFCAPCMSKVRKLKK